MTGHVPPDTKIRVAAIEAHAYLERARSCFCTVLTDCQDDGADDLLSSLASLAGCIEAAHAILSEIAEAKPTLSVVREPPQE